MRSIGTEYLYSLIDKGLMRDYSDEHFILRALRNDPEIIKDYSRYIGNKSAVSLINFNFALSFIHNLSVKLKILSDIFPQNDMECFVKNQLAAGKNNYSDHAFFEALSEISVLIYIGMFGGRVKQALYEPNINCTGKNPEARFIFDDDIVIDVEVKMPNFHNIDLSSIKYGAIKPNMALTDFQIKEIKDFCHHNNLNLIFPRVLKIKDYINAAEKFSIPTTARHFNLLFVNWTYTDIPECELNEPLTIITNPVNGFFSNNIGINLCGINEEYRNCLSAVVIYRDTFDSLMACDFRYQFKRMSFRYIINDLFNTNLEYNLLSKALGMNPCNTSVYTEWYPYDYIFTGLSAPDIQKKCREFLEPLLIGGLTNYL